MEKDPINNPENSDTQTEYPSFEEHMRKLNGEKSHQEKTAEIEENIAELNSDKAAIFIAGRTNGISRIDIYYRKCGDKVQSETGEMEDRKMSEQYAIWRVAKDIAGSYSQEAPRHIRMKALRDFSVVERLWMGKSLDAQKKDCDDKIIALDESASDIAKRPTESIEESIRRLGELLRLQNDCNNHLLRRDSIDKIASDLIPYIQEYEQYEQGLDK